MLSHQKIQHLITKLDLFSLNDEVPWTPQQYADKNRLQMMLIGESLTPNVSAPNGPNLDHYFKKGRWISRFIKENHTTLRVSLETVLHRIGAEHVALAEDALVQ